MSRYARGKFTPTNPEKYLGNHLPTYRSSWEFAFCKFCDEHPSVTKWASESINIPYQNPLTGRSTIYVPDFFIVYVDAAGQQHAELIEVKPVSQTVKERTGKNLTNQAAWIVNQAKWTAAQYWCKQKGIKFRVITENDLFHTGKKR
jgi:hypothetical protein